MKNNNSNDHEMPCKSLMEANNDCEQGKEDIITNLLNEALRKIDILSSEVTQLKNLIQTNNSSIKASEEHYSDDLCYMANLNSPITYTEKMCLEMEQACMKHILHQSNVPTVTQDKIIEKYHSLKDFVNARVGDFIKVEGVSQGIALTVRSYIDDTFDCKQALFTPEIVNDIKKVYLNYIVCSIGLHISRRELTHHYSTLDDLSNATKGDLLFCKGIGPAKANKLCNHLKTHYNITVRD